jgi:hypothetical protein
MKTSRVKTIVLDLESIPASTEVLERLMPEEIRSPVMPDELAHPFEPDWSAKCPKYGGDETRQAEWKYAARKKWAANAEEARSKWQQEALDNRARYVENAALHAETGHVKMIGLTVDGAGTVYLWEPDRAKVAIVEREAAAQKVTLFPFMLEKQMFTRFAKDFVAMMDPHVEPNVAAELKDRARVITYYGNTFDHLFMARRAAIVGEPALMRFLRLHMRGRYFDSTRFVDLHEAWVMGDRETRTGGLEGLCKIFGVEGKSAPCGGGTFYKFYNEDPSEGLVYLLRDLAATEACAKRMGFEL